MLNAIDVKDPVLPGVDVILGGFNWLQALKTFHCLAKRGGIMLLFIYRDICGSLSS